ncbi:glycosyltransferase [Algisphaera agarilytica]|uniref:Glycogen(Starch) synthase n=1 Tax=Algisphaera agarilytica TaxID=1385975 RepID=A0A7X0H894_9BACT|nr:glycosyltransferase [Algisphaera agarilytica]MBB6429640.1 glycogen(starch) synthase [Algisphaera agarilytica]
MNQADPAVTEALATDPAATELGKPSRRGRRADPMLLEIAWEACNQVGGIYTVLRSKVPSMVSRWGNRYCLVGPYNDKSAPIEFEPSPLVGPVGQAVKQMNEMGYRAEYGRWLVSGRPHIVLLHIGDTYKYLNDIKYRLWADHGIPTPNDDALINDVLAFGESTRLLLSMLGAKESHRRRIVAHFHEWMAGAAVPMLRREAWPGSIVFTTHATLLGRYLAMHNPVFYDHLSFFDAGHEAKHFNIEAQHGLERAAAHGAHVFTTVSDVTAAECTHLLGRDPDLLLPNGLNIERFAAIHEFQNLHKQYKQQIHEFTMGHFFPSYSFDLDNTLYMFTSGRYEYRNKGMDLTIEALARLNHRLKTAETPVTVVFFIITKAPVRSVNVAALESRAMLEEFQNAADAIKESIGKELFNSAAAGHIPDLNTLVDDYWRLRLRRSIQSWKRDGLPPIVTHDMVDDGKDAVLNQLRHCQLFNAPEDRVKVVFHPDFINSTNPLFGMEYDQFVRGTHLGVFPSYYEPWGYTPLESIALGVPAITSDLSGFGSYLAQVMPGHDDQGISVVHRRHADFNGAAHELCESMFNFCQLSRRERITLRNTVESFSEHFDWHNLGRRYHEAHEMALDRDAH